MIGIWIQCVFSVGGGVTRVGGEGSKVSGHGEPTDVGGDKEGKTRELRRPGFHACLKMYSQSYIGTSILAHTLKRVVCALI